MTATKKAVNTRPDGDFKIELKVTTADGKTHKDSFTIINSRGVFLPSKLSDPTVVTAPIRAAIAGVVGGNNIR